MQGCEFKGLGFRGLGFRGLGFRVSGYGLGSPNPDLTSHAVEANQEEEEEMDPSEQSKYFGMCSS